jgi:hypothetical protein
MPGGSSRPAAAAAVWKDGCKEEEGKEGCEEEEG